MVAPQEPPSDVASSFDAADTVPQPTEPRFLRVWASVELAIAAIFLIIIFAAVLWQVISRYLPSLNWPGVGELANYSLIVLTFIMVGYLIGKNGHITIQVIDYLVKGRGRTFTTVRIASAICVAVICVLLAWEAYSLVLAFPNRRTAALEIPIWILYLVPLAGFTSGAIRAVVNILLAGKPESKFDAAEAK